jgi:hypothetical protein
MVFPRIILKFKDVTDRPSHCGRNWGRFGAVIFNVMEVGPLLPATRGGAFDSISISKNHLLVN